MMPERILKATSKELPSTYITRSEFAILAISSIILAAVSFKNYLFFHTLIELYGIIIACSVFIIAVNTYQFAKNRFFLFVGISYGTTAIIDLFHTFTYQGMSIVPGLTANIPTQLWIISRYLESMTLLTVIALYHRLECVNIPAAISGYFTLSGLLLWSILGSGVFPDCFLEGAGLTTFKIVSEYIITTAGLLATYLILYKGKNLFSDPVRLMLVYSLMVGVIAELLFTGYTQVYGFANMLGHIFRFISDYFIYRALIRFTLIAPYQSLYREITEANKALDQKSDELSREILKREKMDREIFRLQSLNLVGEMAAAIGHEVRNPITSVRGYLQYFGQKQCFSAYLQQFKLMIDELDRANAIITGFLSLAKNKAIERKPLNLNTVITNMLPIITANALMNNRRISTKLSKIPDIIADEKEIRQCLLNLAANGLEAMPENGLLSIETFVDKDDRPVLTVRDQGAGIPKEIEDKLGTPFVTTKTNGTGLGLAVCYSVASRHNAVIDYETSGEGTSFYIRFKPNQVTGESEQAAKLTCSGL